MALLARAAPALARGSVPASCLAACLTHLRGLSDSTAAPAPPGAGEQHSSGARSSEQRHRPVAATALRLRKKEKVLEVDFDDGRTQAFSAELLRVCSPSAENCSTGGNIKVPAGRRYVGIMSLELVGNYAVRISFDDLHSTGIYTWDYLRELGDARFSRAKAYLRALRAQGQSRDPRARGGAAPGVPARPGRGGG